MLEAMLMGGKREEDFIVVGRRFSVTKMNMKGEVQWTIEEPGENVAIDSNGFIYTTSRSSVVKRTSDGEAVWEAYVPQNLTSIAVSKSGRVAVTSTNNRLYMLSSSGSALWFFSFGNNATCCCFDPLENVYAGSNDNTLRKISTSGNQLWTLQRPSSGPVNSIISVGYAISSDRLWAGQGDGYWVRSIDAGTGVSFSAATFDMPINTVAIGDTSSQLAFGIGGNEVQVGSLFSFNRIDLEGFISELAWADKGSKLCALVDRSDGLFVKVLSSITSNSYFSEDFYVPAVSGIDTYRSLAASPGLAGSGFWE